MAEALIGQQAAPAGTIKDTDTRNFVRDVIQESQQQPVIVDFWAPWCGPCKTLGPVIERAVQAAGGRVKLVKVNIDQNQQLAQQMRIQSIPAVIAFHNGQPVDGFVGAVPESQVKQFVQRLAGAGGPSPIDDALEQALEAQEAGDLQRAAAIYGQIVRAEPGNALALAGLAQCYIAAGDLAQARRTLDTVPPEQRNLPEVVSALATLELAEDAGEVGDRAGLEARLAADPADHEARFDLANALLAQGENEAAVDHLLELVRRNRAWNEEAARKRLVKLFEAFGPTDPLTLSARRRLSSLLFS